MDTTNTDVGLSAQSLIVEFQKQLLDLDDGLTKLSSESSWPVADIAETYFQLNSFKGQLSLIVKQMETFLIERMTDAEAMSVSSGDMLVKEWSKNRKAWQHKELAKAVADRIQSLAIDMDTGEKTMSTGEMIEALLEYVQPSYWRVGALQKIGLNADSYCESGDSEPKIKIERAK